MVQHPVREQPDLLPVNATRDAVRPTKIVGYVMLVLAGLFGGAGLLAFMLFLIAGPFGLVNLGLGETRALLLNAFLCLAFFIQHSFMPRKPFRRWLARYLPEKYYGALYAIVSGIVVLPLVVFWQESAYALFAPQGLVRWSLRAVIVLSGALLAWTLWALGFFLNFRLHPIIDDLRGTDPQPASVIVRGPYSWVRHPLYLVSLLMIWSYPDMTLDRLLFNLLFTIWIVVGILLEERDLVATYGESYRSYRSKVPMLIPWRIRPGQ
jgi:protein-S-isoprenylcysteine O-methyltransferase Ste14